MQNKILFSGCSYSCGHPSITKLVSDLFKEVDSETIAKSFAMPGHSNASILKKIYDAINLENFNNSIIFCQLTHLHRIGCYHDITNCWVDHQPYFSNPIPTINESTGELNIEYEITYNKILSQDNGINAIFPDDEIRKEIKVAYETYLKYVFNQKETFNDLMYKVDLITEYVKQKNCKIVFLFWPELKNKDQINELKKRSFFNIDGNYSMLDYTVKNKLINNHDMHLSENGMIFISEKLYQFAK